MDRDDYQNSSQQPGQPENTQQQGDTYSSSQGQYNPGATNESHHTGTGTTDSQGRRTFNEEFKVSGDRVVETVKGLIREGNVRRITIKNEEGRTLLEIPLTLGVVGTVLLPVWAAIGAVAALVANMTISVERVADAPDADAPHGTGPGDTPGT